MIRIMFTFYSRDIQTRNYLSLSMLTKVLPLDCSRRSFHTYEKKLWKENFWSRSFCLLTTGGAPIEVVKKYIESQGRK
jgi:REP element-mobilizing transposase RayT